MCGTSSPMSKQSHRPERVYILYTNFMTVSVLNPSTTIKVSQATHRTLKAGATSYRSIDDYINHLLRLEERQRMVEAMRQAVSATAPEQMVSWRAESDVWETTSLADAR